MDEELIQQLIAFVRETAPTVWQMGQQRIYASIIVDSIWLALGIVLMLLSRKAHGRARNRNDVGWAYALLGAGLVVAMVAGSALVFDVIATDYWVLTSIFDIVQDGGK